jgi:hypothetical protein
MAKIPRDYVKFVDCLSAEWSDLKIAANYATLSVEKGEISPYLLNPRYCEENSAAWVWWTLGFRRA